MLYSSKTVLTFVLALFYLQAFAYEQVGRGWCASSAGRLCAYGVGSSYLMNPYSDAKCRSFCDKYVGCMGWSNARQRQGGCNLYFLSDAEELKKYPRALPGFRRCGPWCSTNIRTSVNAQCKEAGGFIEYGGSDGKSNWIRNHYCYRKEGAKYQPAVPTEKPTGTPTESPTKEPTKMPTDTPTASSGVAYQNYRWTPTELRGRHRFKSGCGYWVEMAELELYDSNGSLITWSSVGEKAGGCRSNQQAKYAFDGSVGGTMYATGRWNPQDTCQSSDRGCAALEMSIDKPVSIAKYQWVTGTVRKSDPISWTLEGRNGNDDPWVVIDVQDNFDVPSASKSTVGPFVIDTSSTDPSESCPIVEPCPEGMTETTSTDENGCLVVSCEEASSTDPSESCPIVEPCPEGMTETTSTDENGCLVVSCKQANPSYQNYRWMPTELRGRHRFQSGCGYWVEMAELELYDSNGSLITWSSVGEKAGGCRSNQQAKYAFDGSVGGTMYATGRWNPQDTCQSSDRGCAALEMSIDKPVSIAKYQWVTGTVRKSDPISWTLEGRNGNDPWVVIDVQKNFDVPSESKSTVGPFVIETSSTDPSESCPIVGPCPEGMTETTSTDENGCLVVSCKQVDPSYQNYRWMPTELRGRHRYKSGCGYWVEMAELELYDSNGSLVTWDAVGEKAGGCRSNQQAKYAFDGSVGGTMYATGRWNPQNTCQSSDRGCAYLEMAIAKPVNIAKYQWVTGAVRDSDPISWTLEGRNSKDDPWVVIDVKTNFDVPSVSKSTVGPFLVGNPCPIVEPCTAGMAQTTSKDSDGCLVILCVPEKGRRLRQMNFEETTFGQE